eukprot:TRINITY_DN1663_c0_g1_i1.p1 TRINITY_DN1663_c0_g1~~TRINITY_DN1663_c0_g1_i1.p1  ORF type:complete len:376 (-),score=74.25 TRINITY_DN1663_c0_g1_i1:111-1238(-)
MEEGSGAVVGVCIVGFGLAGAEFHAPLVRACSHLRLVAVVTTKKAEEVAAKLGFDEASSKDAPKCYATLQEASAGSRFELVVIASPNKNHIESGLAAIALNKNVVIDKPMACSTSEADQLIDAARKANVKLSVFHNRHWDSDITTVRKVLPQLGEIMSFRSEYKRFRPEIRDNWRWRPEEPASGQLWDLGPHLIQQAVTLFGTPSHVSCTQAKQRVGAETPDYFSISLFFAERPRLICQLESGVLFLSSQIGERSLYVYGDQGSFEKLRGIDSQEGYLRSGKQPGCPGWGEEPAANHGLLMKKDDTTATTIPSEKGDYLAYYNGVAAAILDKTNSTPLPITAEHARLIIALIEAAIESDAKGGAKVSIKPSDISA